MTHELAGKLEAAGVAFTTRWLEGWRELAPETVELRHFGSALAPANRALPELDFANRVMGLTSADEGHVEEIVAFYRERGLRPWFELVPAPGFDRLAERLGAAGAAQIGFHAVLFGAPVAASRPPGLTVRRVEPGEAPLFAATHLRGHEVSGADPRPVERWAAVEGWHLYLAEIEGEPAATAAMSFHDGIAYLANAATIPAWRGRGCQTALIARRVADARAAGAAVLTSQAEFASSSHRNLARAGLEVAFTKAVWRLRR